ncbi:unnamed protein product, partial [Laminaria digitata]
LPHLKKQVLVEKVNKDFDIPLLTEGMEARIISKLVEKVAPQVEPSLLAIMPSVYVACIKLALDEEVPIQDRKDKISKLLRDELAGPLARELNERVDVTMIPEQMEGAMLKIMAKIVINEYVEWTVGHVNEKLEPIAPGHG